MEKGREGERETEKELRREGGSRPSPEGHTHEWPGVGGTREAEIMNGRP